MRGETSADTKTQVERLKTNHDVLMNGCTALSLGLNVPPPDLQTEEEKEMDEMSGIKFVNQRGSGEGEENTFGPWDDEEERRLYEHYPDLRDRLPGACLSGAIDKEEVSETAGGDLALEEVQEDIAKAAMNNVKIEKGPLIVETKLELLRDVSNRKDADAWAVDYGLHNSKSSRRRVVRP
jgi:hypothetical protein